MAVLQADVLLSLTNAKFLPIMAFLSIVRWCTKIEKYQVSFLLEGISRAVWVQITKYGKICAIALLCMFNFLCFLFFTFFKLWTGWIFRNICCRAGWLTVREIINLKGYILWKCFINWWPPPFLRKTIYFFHYFSYCFLPLFVKEVEVWMHIYYSTACRSAFCKKHCQRHYDPGVDYFNQLLWFGLVGLV